MKKSQMSKISNVFGVLDSVIKGLAKAPCNIEIRERLETI